MKDLIIREIENNGLEILLIENDVLLERYVDNDDNYRIEGNIYIGKVQNVLPGMQAAFVNIGKGKNTFIHLKDILPKLDVTEANNNTKSDINIKDIIKPGMPLLVEVKRDSTSKKGARVSTHLSLPGRFIVLMPNTPFITVSQKIEKIEEKERLKGLIKSMLPEDIGAIIRTTAESVSEKEIKEDVDRLLKVWDDICNESTENIPKLVYDNGGILGKTITDLIDTNLDNIIVDSAELKKRIEQILDRIHGKKVEVIVKKNELNEKIYKQLKSIENRKIWLKCGGFITIDKTEALTAVDVNSGKYIGEDNLESTVYTVNKEASIEIAKQLKLRDIGGIIIIDFIDMFSEEDKNKIVQILESELKKDRSKTQIQGFTKLNLLEMTRKHICSN